MGRHTLEGNPPIEVNLRKSVRARRLSLRVSRLDGRVTLTLPQSTAEREGIAFLRTKEAWLRGHLNQLAPSCQVAVGGDVMVHGQLLPIVIGPTKRVRMTSDVVEVPDAATAAPRIKAQFRQMARDTLAAASDRYAQALGRRYSRLSIRDTRSRWGSCSSTGTLMYSWRLIMAPPAVLDYVAAHEVAHLIEMNHSSAFWNVVVRLCPDYAQHRQWLRDHGDQLHRFRFEN
ncbi:MAG: SprT family zinc-dependent metalloprotease [Pseudomonadota bacterium]